MLKLATVLFLILVFVPAAAPREGAPEPLVNCIIDVPAPETWGSLDGGGTLPKSIWIVFRLAFPLMILAAVPGAFAAELIPQPALTGQVRVIGIVAVALIPAFLPVPMAFDVAIAFLLMAHGTALP